MARVERLIETAHLAKRLSAKSAKTWTPKRVARVLSKAGCAWKVGGRWVTTRSRIREAGYDILLEVLD